MNNNYLTREEAIRQINMALGVTPETQGKEQARAVIKQKLIEAQARQARAGLPYLTQASITKDSNG